MDRSNKHRNYTGKIMAILLLAFFLAITVFGCGGQAGESGEETERVVIEDSTLRMELIRKEHVFIVTDTRTGHVWKSKAQPGIVITQIEEINGTTLALSLLDRQTNEKYTCTVSIEENGVLSFEIDANDLRSSMEGISNYPPSFTGDLEEPKMLFTQRSNGVYIDLTDKTYGGKTLTVYGNTDCVDMPWVGVVDHKLGHGYMMLIETPTDARISFRDNRDRVGEYWPQVTWINSMGTFRYARRISYRFSPGGGYVALAKMYREYVNEHGYVKTLEEKAREKPKVEWLKGAPVLWGGYVENDELGFVKEIRTYGITRGIVENAWAPKKHIEILTEWGYVAGEYHNFSDISAGERGINSDDVNKVAYRPWLGAGPAEGWRTLEGLQHYVRSSEFLQEVAERFLPERIEHYSHTLAFLDVTAAVDLMEDYHPDHTFDRRRDLENRRALYEVPNDLGLIVGTEHGNDWIMDRVEIFEGAMSGPFWWDSWPAGHLVAPTREDLSYEYLKYGMGYENRIPLWELVYHDCAISTWYWGDNAGFLYHAAPELADRKDLFNILYGTIPLFWRDDYSRDKRGYGWDVNRARFLQTYHETCKLHEVIAFQEMVSHEFLSEDYALQRTVFGSGVEVVVNFGDEPRVYANGEVDVVLAPRGYYVNSSEIVQQKLWVDGDTVTLIQKEGYFLADTTSRRQIGPVELTGRFIAFETDSGRWNLIVEKGHQYHIDLTELTGAAQDTEYHVVKLNDNGIPIEYVTTSVDGKLEIIAQDEPELQVFGVYPGGVPLTETVEEWTFDDLLSDDMWSPAGGVWNMSIKDGLLVLDITGENPLLMPPWGTIKITTTPFDVFKVKLKNESPNTVLKLQWVTDVSSQWTDDKTAVVEMVPNDTELREYSIPVSKLPKWEGTVTHLLITIGAEGEKGTVVLESVGIYSEISFD